MPDNEPVEQCSYPEVAPIAKACSLISTMYPNMPIQRLQCFFHVYLNQGCTTQNIIAMMRLSQASVSRNMGVLGQDGWLDHRSKKRSKGLHLIEKVPDPSQPHRYIYRTTALGEIFAKMISNQIDRSC